MQLTVFVNANKVGFITDPNEKNVFERFSKDSYLLVLSCGKAVHTFLVNS